MKRALLIGSQTGGLTGVHSDVELLDETLRRLGFATRPTLGRDATADGIVGRYRELIEETDSGDAAVVYYSGHGARTRNPLAATDPPLPPWVHYLVPTDFDDSTGDRVRVVLAEELSLLQQELTAKTRNVTVILDCCHSARMSRDPDLLPKASDQLVVPGGDLVRRWQRLRGAALEADANPDAVRVVACGPDGSAYEFTDAQRGRRHGALTAALADVLAQPEMGSWTWLDVQELLRDDVLGASAFQRPAVEGPTERLLFALGARGGTGVLPVRIEQGLPVLPDAALFGVATGDTYALVGPGGEVTAPLATATVQRIAAGFALLDLHGVTVAQLPELTTAWPIRVALNRRPVAVHGPAGADRADVEEELEGSVRLRVAPAAARPLATVCLDPDGVQVLDAGGQPLYRTPLSGPSRIHAAVADVHKLAHAEHVRGLASGTGPAELPADVTVSLLRLLPDGGEVAVAPGDHLFVGDLMVVRVFSSAARRFAGIVDIGIAGAVTLLTRSEPDGVTLTPGVAYELGRDWLAGGIPLGWPAAVPAGAPRPESLLVIVTDGKVDRLPMLGQPGVTRGAAHPASALDRLIDNVATGRRDAPAAGAGSGVRHRVERFDFVFHPTSRPRVDEPPFEIDERPHLSFRLVEPASVASVPTRLAVRLEELTGLDDRSRARVDALVITAGSAGAGLPYRATTLRLPDGDRLLHDGPVERFLDIALWVGPDDGGHRDLAQLIAAEASTAEVAGAIATLAAPSATGPAPAAGSAAGTVAAVAALVRAAGRVLDRDGRRGVGVYRTSLLAHQGFGVGGSPTGLGRRPAHGLLRAEGIGFALELVGPGAG